VERLITKINVSVKLEQLSINGKAMKYKKITLKQYRINVALYITLVVGVMVAVICFSMGAF
jgi:hypothetical protein